MESSVEHFGTPSAVLGAGSFDLPRNRFSNAVDSVVVRAGDAASWLWPLLVAVVVLQVVLRYGFGRGSAMLEELQWHIYAVGFMIGLSYCANVDRHVRVDVIYRSLSVRARAAIDLAGTILFLLPLCGYLVYETLPYVESSVRFGERSREAGGLPGLFLLKAVIPLMAVLLTVQGLAVVLKCVAVLRQPRES